MSQVSITKSFTRRFLYWWMMVNILLLLLSVVAIIIAVIKHYYEIMGIVGGCAGISLIFGIAYFVISKRDSIIYLFSENGIEIQNAKASQKNISITQIRKVHYAREGIILSLLDSGEKAELTVDYICDGQLKQLRIWTKRKQYNQIKELSEDYKNLTTNDNIV